MIKYSLVLLTAAAVIFSTGCESECCGTPAPTALIDGLNAGATVTTSSFTLSGARSHDNNDGGTITNYSWTVDGVAANEGQTLSAGSHEVCLTVTDNDGLTNETCGTVVIGVATGPKAIITQLAITCTVGDTLNVSGSTSTGSPVSYAWTPSAIGTTASGTINCPAAGVAQEVCLTVTDSAGATNQTCSTVTGAAEATSCNPAITAKDSAGNVVTTVSAGGIYTFENNVTAANCPAAECTWSASSTKNDNEIGGYYTCLIENSHANTDDESNTDPHVTLMDTGSNANILIRTCSASNNYKVLKVDLDCTNPTYNKTKKYTFQ